MRKILLTAAAFALATTMGAGAAPALADGHSADKPEQLKQDWYRVNLVRFKEGKQGRAQEIIAMFEKTDEAVGRDGPVMVHMNTGKWHMMVFFKMDHGIEQLGYASAADGGAWAAAFNELAGGEEEADKIWQEYTSLIAERERHIGHIHPDEDEEG
ncbi:MAG: hypothetical protein HKP43_02080 [Altererythrobacter sp.]|nr:hypothetical protein [Altererythrobacter sp.]MBT8431303.1 hypothetical protein [Altererythrobacter sp.]NNE49322.1 hypothetical protein [Altererythrobacter sp.]NNF94767.1 hypothetical protein [Altererythrobacter sp.]NNK45398.1 hypothetical protein [Altererythrobacter sp.]